MNCKNIERISSIIPGINESIQGAEIHPIPNQFEEYVAEQIIKADMNCFDDEYEKQWVGEFWGGENLCNNNFKNNKGENNYMNYISVSPCDNNMESKEKQIQLLMNNNNSRSYEIDPEAYSNNYNLNQCSNLYTDTSNGIDMENQMRNQMGNQMRNQMGNQMGNQMRNQMRNQMENQMENQMDSNVTNNMNTENQMGNNNQESTPLFPQIPNLNLQNLNIPGLQNLNIPGLQNLNIPGLTGTTNANTNTLFNISSSIIVVIIIIAIIWMLTAGTNY